MVPKMKAVNNHNYINIMNDSNYTLSLLKQALKKLLSEVDSSYWFVEYKYMNAVRKALEEINPSDVPNDLPFSISTYCALLKARNEYGMPIRFLSLATELKNEIEEFIN